MKLALPFILLLTAVIAAPARAADPLDAGIQLYHRGDFEAAARALEDAVGWIRNRDMRAKGHLYRGLAQAVLGAWPDARGSFERALTDDPEITPDAERVPPAIVGAFAEVRQSMRAELEVVSSTRALVSVDGQAVGETPVVVRWPIGRHAVLVETPDRQLRFHQRDVLFRADEPTRIVAVLAPRFGALTVRSYPTGADVRIDGRLTGRTPLAGAQLPAGEAEVTVELPGYRASTSRVLIPAEGEATVDATLTLAPDAEREPPPVFGPDLRARADAWTFDFALGAAGVVPLAAQVQTADPEQLGVSGGLALHVEAGVSLWDLVQVVGVLGVDTFGPELSLYRDVLADRGATTEFVFDEGFGGALHARQIRLGVEGRLTLLRADRLHAFAGVGVYALPSVGAVVSVAPESAAGADDAYGLRATLDARAIAPLLGARWTLWERLEAGRYMTAELMMEARLDVVSWGEPKVEQAALGAEATARASAARARWDAALDDAGSTVAAAVLITALVRL